ncbi:efflux RND transporter permease subunit [Indioceanicola profundi]|uniref:efflux RND transporter permease subunit n=1 Tax=Indioceanicola profundi TaxID=2220096 RepID=UPI000E6AB9F3|nr:CusA/CzcA family heavy metal efflux RND transporter [Indioceanicola profundi]
MIARLIHWSVANRLIVLLLAAILAAGGIWAARNTPVDAIPDLSDVQVIVKTSWPGQAPQVVEDQVTYPLSTAFLAVPGAKTVRGYSMFGDSYVYVLFEDGTDLYWARSRVLEYLSQIAPRLPVGATPALGPDATGVGWIYQYVLVDRTGQHDISELRTLQDWFLKFELQSLPGVAEVAPIGGMVRQYQVVVDPDALRAYDLPLAAVQEAIQAANQSSGGSVLEMAEAEYMVRASGYVQSVEDLEAVPLKANPGGVPVLLRDVAEIRTGPELRRGVSELNGEGEVTGAVVILRQGENALAAIKAVEARIEELRPSLPNGVEIVTTYDRSDLIERAVDNLWHKLGEEFIVVVLVSAAFLLHLRSSLVVVLTMPLGVLAAFIVMHFQGVNANIMSLGGIAIAIGAMVDAAIVMVESLHRRIEQEPITRENRWRLVSETAAEVGPALFSSLVIITLSFLPVFALEAQEGRMFKPLAYTKTYAMAASAILSVTLVPVLMGLFVRGRIVPERRNPLNNLLIWLYRPALNAALAAPWTVIIAAVLLVASMAYPLSKTGSEFMPSLNEGDLLYMPSLLPDVSISKATELMQITDRLIKTVPEVETVHGKIGRAESATDPAPIAMFETTIRLKPREEWRPGMTLDGIRAELDRVVQIPGMPNTWTMPIKNRIDMLATGIKTPVGIKVFGPDLEGIGKVASEIEAVVKTVPGATSAYAERPAGGRYIDVEVDRLAAARYGLSVAEVQQVVRAAIGGEEVTQTVEGTRRFPVNVRFAQAWRDSPEALASLPVVTPSGAHIALGEVAKVRIEDGPSMLKTENARLTASIFVDIADRDLGSFVADAKRAVAEQVTLPPGYSLTWTGQFEYMARVQDRLTAIVPLTLALIALMLWLTFRRGAEVLIVLTSLPVALAGGMWLIWYLGFNLSVAVSVGFIALAGVAVETAVIMLVYLNIAMKRHEQLAMTEGRSVTVQDIREAVIEGAVLRLRPKAMTVATIFAGLLPIMVGEGTGSEVMQRIAAPMIGGMATTTVLTLAVVPAVFLVWQRARLRKQPAVFLDGASPSSLPARAAD